MLARRFGSGGPTTGRAACAAAATAVSPSGATAVSSAAATAGIRTARIRIAALMVPSLLVRGQFSLKGAVRLHDLCLITFGQLRKDHRDVVDDEPSVRRRTGRQTCTSVIQIGVEGLHQEDVN